MGALLSLPLLAIPSITTIGSFAASCCGAAACSALCSACGKCQSSTATRIAYALIFLVNSILSWIMLTPWAIRKLEHLALDTLPISCFGEQCYGFVAVHRINFALGVFHAILAVLLLGVRSSRNGRAGIQNGYWGPKIIAWLALIVLTFLIPEQFFIVWGYYFAMIGATLFLLLGLILLVDLAHTWAETCLQNIIESDSRMWRGVLIGSTLGMYVGSLVMTILMYIFFAGADCKMNQAAITVNMLLIFISSAISVHPTIQEYNPTAGLAQSAMVAVYCTYLTMSAVSMEPDDKQCNPLLRARGTRTASIVLGAIVTLLTIAYTTTRAATQSPALGKRSAPANGGYGSLTPARDHTLIDQEPTPAQMRQQALIAAVESGSLPATALDDDSDADDDEYGGRSGDDEKGATQYSYSFFHIIFLLATAWTACLLTMSIEPGKGDEEGFTPVGRTYAASWVKIVSAWVCYGIYVWTLAAPWVLPDRFDRY
ncbi:serine incorporator/TMS membrane protein [Geopyxis carbonaria]|nr:serine incorporator/TMS membrane protein [Geopyxis carbonaria]